MPEEKQISEEIKNLNTGKECRSKIYDYLERNGLVLDDIHKGFLSNLLKRYVAIKNSNLTELLLKEKKFNNKIKKTLEEEKEQSCVHGRTSWRHCPHCLGVNQ